MVSECGMAQIVIKARALFGALPSAAVAPLRRPTADAPMVAKGHSPRKPSFFRTAMHSSTPVRDVRFG